MASLSELTDAGDGCDGYNGGSERDPDSSIYAGSAWGISPADTARGDNAV